MKPNLQIKMIHNTKVIIDCSNLANQTFILQISQNQIQKPNKIEIFLSSITNRQLIFPINTNLNKMNIETYQTCIRTLQNQIKTREQQRQSMQQTIGEMDRQLRQEISKNAKLKDEIVYLAQNNQGLVMEMRRLEEILHERDAVIDQCMARGTQLAGRNGELQQQVQYLEDQIAKKVLILQQKDSQITNLQSEVKKNSTLAQGYKTVTQQKAAELSRYETKLVQLSKEKESLQKNFIDAKTKFQSQKKEMLQRATQSLGSASSITRDLQAKVQTLQLQLQSSKEFHHNQIETLTFNHESLVTQQQRSILQLKDSLSTQTQQIAFLESQQQKLKQYYENQIENNDKVVNTLINEINYLKEEKVEMKKQNTMKWEESVQQVFLMGLSLAEKEAKAREYQAEVKRVSDQLLLRENELGRLNKEIEKLKLELDVVQKQKVELKETLAKKAEEIVEMRKFTQNLKKFAQVADNEKQAVTKKTYKQLQHLRTQNLQLSKRLQRSQHQLYQLRITSVQHQQTIKTLTLTSTTSTQHLSQLQSTITGHQYTIQKLQSLLQQSQKVIFDMNRLMKTKLDQIETLEFSNLMFRREKLEWIRREEEYRKKASQLRSNVSFVGGRRGGDGAGSVVGSGRSRKFSGSRMLELNAGEGDSGNLNHRERVLVGAQSQVGFSDPKHQPHPYSASFVNGIRSKTMPPVNWLEKLKNYDSGDDQPPVESLDLGEREMKNNAFKKPLTPRPKKVKVKVEGGGQEEAMEVVEGENKGDVEGLSSPQEQQKHQQQPQPRSNQQQPLIQQSTHPSAHSKAPQTQHHQPPTQSQTQTYIQAPQEVISAFGRIPEDKQEKQQELVVEQGKQGDNGEYMNNKEEKDGGQEIREEVSDKQSDQQEVEQQKYESLQQSEQQQKPQQQPEQPYQQPEQPYQQAQPQPEQQPQSAQQQPHHQQSPPHPEQLQTDQCKNEVTMHHDSSHQQYLSKANNAQEIQDQQNQQQIMRQPLSEKQLEEEELFRQRQESLHKEDGEEGGKVKEGEEEERNYVMGNGLEGGHDEDGDEKQKQKQKHKDDINQQEQQEQQQKGLSPQHQQQEQQHQQNQHQHQHQQSQQPFHAHDLQQQYIIPRKISPITSPINSRVLIKQDGLGCIMEDDQLNELSQLHDLKEPNQEEGEEDGENDDAQQAGDNDNEDQEAHHLSQSHQHQHDPEDAQNTVNGISHLLDRLNDDINE